VIKLTRTDVWKMIVTDGDSEIADCLFLAKRNSMNEYSIRMPTTQFGELGVLYDDGVYEVSSKDYYTPRIWHDTLRDILGRIIT